MPISTIDKLSYASSDVKNMSVTSKGLLTAKKAAKGKGTAQIAITAGKVKKTCKVTVK